MTDLEEVREMYRSNQKLFFTNDADGSMLYRGQLHRLFNYFGPMKIGAGLYLFGSQSAAIIKGIANNEVEWF